MRVEYVGAAFLNEDEYLKVATAALAWDSVYHLTPFVQEKKYPYSTERMINTLASDAATVAWFTALLINEGVDSMRLAAAPTRTLFPDGLNSRGPPDKPSIEEACGGKTFHKSITLRGPRDVDIPVEVSYEMLHCRTGRWCDRIPLFLYIAHLKHLVASDLLQTEEVEQATELLSYGINRGAQDKRNDLFKKHGWLKVLYQDWRVHVAAQAAPHLETIYVKMHGLVGLNPDESKIAALDEEPAKEWEEE